MYISTHENIDLFATNIMSKNVLNADLSFVILFIGKSVEGTSSLFYYVAENEAQKHVNRFLKFGMPCRLNKQETKSKNFFF